MTVDNSEYVNDVELRVFGLQRSGIHAVVNWIVQQSKGPTVFINDIKSLSGNPFVDADDFHWYAEDAGASSPPDWASERAGDHVAKRYLILGYEDTDLRAVPRAFDDLLRESVGPSRVTRNVIVIRDPFNLFASRMGFLNTANRHPMDTHRELVLRLWKIHARECLGLTQLLGTGTVVVKYNQWFADPEYRRAIATELGLSFTDRGSSDVPGVDLPPTEFPRFGCGSSFDNQQFHGRAQEMDVLARWRRFVNDPMYLGLFEDREIVILSHQLFGQVVGEPFAVP